MSDAIRLTGRLDLAAASDLRTTLLDQPPGDIVVDLSGVTMVGALCMQVFVAADKSLRKKGNALRLTDCSDAAAACFAALGVSPDTLNWSTP